MAIFTTQQNLALDTDRHLLVTANAGAGKTTVLVRRFAEIVLSGKAKVHEIVAITYTEKAAGELRRKIAEYIEELLTHPDTPENSRDVLDVVRNQLASATIGTIHSFCSQMLREYPVEAEIDAAFTVLEGPDQQVLIQDSLRETFENILQSNTVERERFIGAVRMLGKTAVQKYLTTFLSNREKMERLIGEGGLYNVLNDDNLFVSHMNVIVEETILDSLWDNRFLEKLARIFENAKVKSIAQVRQKLSSLNALTNSHEKLLEILEFLSLVFTKDSKIRKEVTGPTFDESLLHKEITFACDKHRSASSLIESVRSGDGKQGNQTLLRMIRVLLSVHRLSSEIYERKKQDLGVLDFEDLQLKARDLLKKPEVQSKLSEKFLFVMVDEFQDANRLQYEILTLLVSDYRKGNLFVVGDPKQSIYGFRNAEVEMFEKAREDILGLPRTNTGGEVVLAESFRPLVNVALFVNLLFSRVMGREVHSHAIVYNDIVKGRLNNAGGKVEFLIAKHVEHGESDISVDSVANECSMVARRILHLVQSQQNIFEPRNEFMRPVKYRDVAILLRNRKHVGEIEHALASLKIPYRLTGGIGFYQTQEVFDVLNYFVFLLNRENEVALNGILRSPFFNISDAELFEISLVSGDGTFWEKVQQFSDAHANATSIRHAVKLLKEDILLANRLSIPILVQRIFRKTGWGGSVAAFDQGDQHASNILKLLNLARDFEGRGLHTLYDFVQRLKSLVENEPREGQASLDLQNDCVQVMTIHSAKGLEFPVVFLPFTHEPFRYDATPLIDPGMGIGFGVRREHDLDEDVPTPFYELLQFRNRMKVDAEEKRILYVAATRARDMLVLSGRIEAKIKKPSYLYWVLDAMNISAESISTGIINFKNQSLKVLHRAEDGYLPETIAQSLDIHVLVNDVPEVHSGISEHQAEPEKLGEMKFISQLQGETKGEFFSATQIKTFMECPTKYYMKYLLGLPEVSAIPYDFYEEEEPSDEIRGELEGLLTHAVLQDIGQDSISEAEIKKKVLQLTSVGRNGDNILLIDAVIRNVLSFVLSPFGKEVLAAVESRTEFCLNTVFHDDYVTGIIDRLYKTSNGHWHVLDYKTDKVNPDQVLSRASFHKPQLAMYSYLVHRLFNQDEVTATLLLLRHTNNPVHFIFRKNDFQTFEREVKSCIEKIKHNNFERRVPLCESCTYQKNGKCLIPMEQAV